MKNVQSQTDEWLAVVILCSQSNSSFSKEPDSFSRLSKEHCKGELSSKKRKDKGIKGVHSIAMGTHRQKRTVPTQKLSKI